jgi:hypothetical protein
LTGTHLVLGVSAAMLASKATAEELAASLD